MKRKTLYHIEINGEVCNDILGMADNCTVRYRKFRQIRDNIKTTKDVYEPGDCFLTCSHRDREFCSPYIPANEKEEPIVFNHKYLCAETEKPVYYCNPEPCHQSCAKMLAAGKCVDPWMRENIGAILYPQHYLNQKTK